MTEREKRMKVVKLLIENQSFVSTNKSQGSIKSQEVIDLDYAKI